MIFFFSFGMCVYRRHLITGWWKTCPYCCVLSLPPPGHPPSPSALTGAFTSLAVLVFVSKLQKQPHERYQPWKPEFLLIRKRNSDKSTGARGSLCCQCLVEVHGFEMLSALMLIACVGLGAIVHSQGAVIYWLPYNGIEKHCLWLVYTCMLNHCGCLI